MAQPDIIWFKDCSYKNKSMVGGKCSSLGELYHLSTTLNFDIADGFAITTAFYDEFIINNNLESVIASKLELIERKIKNEPNADEFSEIEIIETMSDLLKDLIVTSQFTKHQRQVIIDNYRLLCDKYSVSHLPVAVRSSAIAEDLPNASFAGQQDTFLNIAGTEHLLDSVKKCFASLFNSRAISYRRTHNIQLADIKISVAIQKMVRADLGSAGVAFSMDPETGYDKAIVINSAFGLGELVVSGGVKPDEYILDKRAIKTGYEPIISKTLGDKQSKMVYNGKNGVKEEETTLKEKVMHSLYEDQVVMLGRHVAHIEEAYSKMFNAPIGVDVEWALDGLNNKLYILQTRPETVHSIKRDTLQITKYSLLEKGDLLISGVAVGDKISSGKIKVLRNMSEYKLFNAGDILVTDMTTPDWEPIMKIAAGIITNKGGRTCHAAIVARELGLTAIVGTSNATTVLQHVSSATLSCDTGETGHVFRGILKHKVDHIEVSGDLSLPVKLMLNVGNPESSFQNSLIPNSGVGLARIEFIINNYIKIHPLALFNHSQLTGDIALAVRAIMGDEHDGAAYFTQNLARGIGKIASAFYPNDVIVRLSDFKSNEYKNLIGGELYEPNEENPMIGWRGASRYYSADYEDAFGMECAAIKCAREMMGMDNVIVMIPFCRTPDECQRVLNTMAKYGLVRGRNGLQVYLMCEIPSNVIEADLFSPLIDGVSIGGNDLLQLTIGVDRDSEKVAFLSDDKNVSYRRMISMAIKTYHLNGVKVGFCGQQPSDSAEFCQFLIDQKIDSISVTPDSAIKTIKNLGV